MIRNEPGLRNPIRCSIPSVSAGVLVTAANAKLDTVRFGTARDACVSLWICSANGTILNSSDAWPTQPIPVVLSSWTYSVSSCSSSPSSRYCSRSRRRPRSSPSLLCAIRRDHSFCLIQSAAIQFPLVSFPFGCGARTSRFPIRRAETVYEASWPAAARSLRAEQSHESRPVLGIPC